MEVHSLVLTGGPCAGKSTALSMIEQRLSNLGYRVIILDEMATNIINSGINPLYFKSNFQDIVAQMIDNREKAYNTFISKHLPKNSKVVIISDRGLLDGMAYCSKDYFENNILKPMNTSIIEVMSRYDGVFHLVTAAIGAEKFYTTKNNKARMETLEQAIQADRRTLNSWIGHPHLRVISNDNVDFDGKINNLMREILSMLGEPLPYEIERKFLIVKPSQAILNTLGAVKIDIIQTYLKPKDKDNLERRIRMRGKNGNYTYYYTEKQGISADTRIEEERLITQSEYIRLLTEADTTKHQIIKSRYCFVYKDKYFELDIYPFWEDKAILEIELSSISDKFYMPDEILVIEEVTNNTEYKNANLANSVPKVKNIEN